jgi:hypothetical protein
VDWPRNIAMMSVHDALEGWQAGEITAARAMRLTGAGDVLELYAFAHQSGVPVRPGLQPREAEQARQATDMIRQLLAAVDQSADGVPAS